MKTQVSRFVGLVATLALLSGCTSINSGNLGHDVKPLKYGADEEAIITTVTTTTDKQGKKTITTKAISETGLAVNKQIQLRKLETARDVGVARAVSGSGSSATRGFWSSLLGPGPGYYGQNGGYYGANGAGFSTAGGANGGNTSYGFGGGQGGNAGFSTLQPGNNGNYNWRTP